ncbi:hypothetical protein NQ315_014050 [Exocentrus adspersus]|uniref:Protein unzipped n=1 Tax=Exocentrus adspersus TaxID=1586481 RepID=A0AAV8VVF9_9CUCU|nr:hypothetical protein NQ315_014050 [Exocentrus adspersus]
MGERYYILLLMLLLKLLKVHGDHSVHILSENLEQYVTSTTLEWVPSNGYDDSLLSNAVIAAYQTVEEPTPNEPGEDEGQETSLNTINKPVYVCRAKINSVWVSGQLRPMKYVCVVSLYRKVSEYKQFEILMSIEGSSRLSWIHKNKYTLISQGAVTSGDNILKTYIARRSANSHNREGSLTHIVGKYTPSENLGVFHLVDQNNYELQFEDGEILVETEPITYEVKSIKFDRFRGRHPKSFKELGQAILKNEEKGLQHVASVISYKYEYSVFWGKGHGLLTGLPFVVILPNGTQTKGAWAVPRQEVKSEVAPIEKYLEPGTAVNVTLCGNLTESEIPYNATIVAIYKDGEKREIAVRDTKRETKMLDIVAYYSPIYYLHNNSHVPTTTTTTTTTTTRTTSTTSKTTSTTQEITPIIVPEVITTHKTVDDKHTHNTNNMMSDGQKVGENHLSDKKPDASTIPDGASPMGVLSVVIVLLISFVIMRVT